MIISHQDAALNKTNSVLNAYYRSLKDSEIEARIKNDNVRIYQKNLDASMTKIDNALNNYYRAAQLMFALEKRIADTLGITINWSDLGLNATTYYEVYNYDLSK